jgi:hypothetical protein
MIRHAAAFGDRPSAQFDGVFEWDWIAAALPGKIEPMDFDGVVERRGQFLLFETKGPGVPIPAGQRYTLQCVAALPQWTVVILWGKTATALRGYEVWQRGRVTFAVGRAAGPPVAAYGPAVADLARAWAAWADGDRRLPFAWTPPADPPPVPRETIVSAPSEPLAHELEDGEIRWAPKATTLLRGEDGARTYRLIAQEAVHALADLRKEHDLLQRQYWELRDLLNAWRKDREFV